MSFWKQRKRVQQRTRILSLEEHLHEAYYCNWINLEREAFKHLHHVAVVVTAIHERKHGETRGEEQKQTN
jgi:hypothetical protein